MGQLKKAAEAAATFMAMEPSDEVMAKNIHYYTTNFKLEADAFVPRQVGAFIHAMVDFFVRHFSF